MADSVRDKIGYRLRDKPRIDRRDAGRFGRSERQGDSGGLGARTERLHRLSHEIDEIGFGNVEGVRLALKPRKVENLLDERVEPLRLLRYHRKKRPLRIGSAAVLKHVDRAEYAGERRLDLVRDVGNKLAAELLEPRELAYPDALAVEREEEDEHSRCARESGEDE